MTQTTVDVDIVKNKFDVAHFKDGKYKHKKFDNTPQQGFAGDVKPLICIEATSAYSIPLAEYLASDYPVALISPAKIKGFAKSELLRVKTNNTQRTQESTPN
jgi:transposase